MYHYATTAEKKMEWHHTDNNNCKAKQCISNILNLTFRTVQARNQDSTWGGANEAKVDQTTEMDF